MEVANYFHIIGWWNNTMIIAPSCVHCRVANPIWWFQNTFYKGMDTSITMTLLNQRIIWKSYVTYGNGLSDLFQVIFWPWISWNRLLEERAMKDWVVGYVRTPISKFGASNLGSLSSIRLFLEGVCSSPCLSRLCLYMSWASFKRTWI